MALLAPKENIAGQRRYIIVFLFLSNLGTFCGCDIVEHSSPFNDKNSAYCLCFPDFFYSYVSCVASSVCVPPLAPKKIYKIGIIYFILLVLFQSDDV